MAPRTAAGADAGSKPELSHSSPSQGLLVRRGQADGNLIFLIVAAVVLVLAALFLVVMSHRRRKRQKYQQTPGDDGVDARPGWHPLNSTAPPRNGRASQPPSASSNRNSAAAGSAAIDRHTSVRSVMTLPAYRQMASQNEQVLGREGERDGIDVIVDLPTEEELEALREEEMDAMYQIRVARRQQIEEQQQRRTERRQAQQRGDAAALAALRARIRASNDNTTIEDLRREMERLKDNRQRSVSSVSYADVGLARHDGTRIRANSNESERMGLLSDAASIAVSHRSGARSPNLHERQTSVCSISSADGELPSPALTRGSQPNTPGLSTSSALAGSSPELVEADLGDEAMPPPGYEDVPLDADEDGFNIRSSTALDEPPPDYSGPYRSASQRSQRSQSGLAPATDEDDTDDIATRRPSRGVGGVPQLPSLRISRLPEIVIEPSSALPRDDHEERR